MMQGLKCEGSCFECKLPDCICNIPGATHWEKKFNKRQREIRKQKEDKKTNRTARSMSRGTLLIRLR